MRRRIGILTASVLVLVWLGAGPASADDTTVTFTVTTGALDIAAPLGPTALTNGTLVPGGTAFGQIGPVDVTDARGTTPSPWTVTVSSTAWSAIGFPSIPSTAATYAGGPVTQTGDGVCAASVTSPIPTTPATTNAVQHTGGTGGNSCLWNPTITVTIPVTASTTTYQATVQQLIIGV